MVADAEARCALFIKAKDDSEKELKSEKEKFMAAYDKQGADKAKNAEDFSGRLERRDEYNATLIAVLEEHDIKVPPPRKSMGAPK